MNFYAQYMYLKWTERKMDIVNVQHVHCGCRTVTDTDVLADLTWGYAKLYPFWLHSMIGDVDDYIWCKWSYDCVSSCDSIDVLLCLSEIILLARIVLIYALVNNGVCSCGIFRNFI